MIIINIQEFCNVFLTLDSSAELKKLNSNLKKGGYHNHFFFCKLQTSISTVQVSLYIAYIQ